MQKITLIQITVAVVVVLGLIWWMTKKSRKPGEGITIVTPMPMSGYSIDDDGYDEDGIPSVLPAAVTPEPVKETYGDMEQEGYAVYDEKSTQDWMIRPEEGYDDYSPTNFKSDLLD